MLKFYIQCWSMYTSPGWLGLITMYSSCLKREVENKMFGRLFFAYCYIHSSHDSCIPHSCSPISACLLFFQMLSMRNGLYLPPGNISGAPEALAPSEMCAALNQSGAEASNSGAFILPGNQIPVARHLFDPPNHDQRHEKPHVLQSVHTSSTAVEPRFLQEPAQPNLQSFQLSLPPEVNGNPFVMPRTCNLFVCKPVVIPHFFYKKILDHLPS